MCCLSTMCMNLHNKMVSEALSNIDQLRYHQYLHQNMLQLLNFQKNTLKILLSFFFHLGEGTCITSSSDTLDINSLRIVNFVSAFEKTYV